MMAMVKRWSTWFADFSVAIDFQICPPRCAVEFRRRRVASIRMRNGTSIYPSFPRRRLLTFQIRFYQEPWKVTPIELRNTIPVRYSRFLRFAYVAPRVAPISFPSRVTIVIAVAKFGPEPGSSKPDEFYASQRWFVSHDTASLGL